MKRDWAYGNQGILEGPTGGVKGLGEEEKELNPKGRLVSLIPPKPPLLSGLVQTHSETDLNLEIRDKPRLIFKPIHALTAILILLVTLAASLTLLIQQSASLTGSVSAQAGSIRSGEATPTPRLGRRGDNQAKNKQPTADHEGEAGKNPASQDAPLNGPSPDQTEHTQNGTLIEQGGRSGQARVDINAADVQALQGVRGIGPVRAQRIVDYRARNGRFRSVDQLSEVSGIGPKTLDKLRPFLVAR